MNKSTKCILYGAVVIFTLTSCRHVESDELLIEEITLDNGTNVYVYHSAFCTICYDYYNEKGKNIGFARKTKIANVIKRKTEVYDLCIDSIHAKALDAISRANMRAMGEHISDVGYESWSYWIKVHDDDTNRIYEVYYSEDKNGELVKIQNKRGYISVWNLSKKHK